jgi:hypothetical protein
MEMQLVLAEAEGDGEHSGGEHVKQDLAEESRSNFKKIDPKSLTNPTGDTVKEGDNR